MIPRGFWEKCFPEEVIFELTKLKVLLGEQGRSQHSRDKQPERTATLGVFSNCEVVSVSGMKQSPQALGDVADVASASSF